MTQLGGVFMQPVLLLCALQACMAWGITMQVDPIRFEGTRDVGKAGL